MGWFNHIGFPQYWCSKLLFCLFSFVGAVNICTTMLYIHVLILICAYKLTWGDEFNIFCRGPCMHFWSCYFNVSLRCVAGRSMYCFDLHTWTILEWQSGISIWSLQWGFTTRAPGNFHQQFRRASRVALRWLPTGGWPSAVGRWRPMWDPRTPVTGGRLSKEPRSSGGGLLRWISVGLGPWQLRRKAALRAPRWQWWKGVEGLQHCRGLRIDLHRWISGDVGTRSVWRTCWW